MLEGIAVENYRIFAQRTHFELSPLTILIGANSSGKSSVTRLFPLLSQSLSVRSSAPVLWVSDELDYGSFNDNVHRIKRSAPIKFTFYTSINQDSARRVYVPSGPAQLVSSPVEYEIAILGSNEETYVDAITIRIYEEEICLNFNDHDNLIGIKFRGKDFSSLIGGRDIRILQRLFPAFYTADKDGTVLAGGTRLFSADAIRLIHGYAHQNTTIQRIQSLLGTFVAPFGAWFARLENRLSSIPTLHRNLSNIDKVARERIWLLSFLGNLAALMQAIDFSVSGDIVSGSYLAPVRASAKRYYRRQELAIDQIDAAGVNLAMYLNSLNPSELAAINLDMVRYFDHSVELTRGEGHISLRLEAKDHTYSDNLADVGFGFSQLIPVVAQIHAARKSRRPRLAVPGGGSSPIIAIEQPELHLHPAYQSQLGEYLAKAATLKVAGETPCRILIETHSEPLVNQVASLVGRGEIAASDVKLYLFDHRPGESESRVVEVEIMADGTIPKWPFRFFASGRLNRDPLFS